MNDFKPNVLSDVLITEFVARKEHFELFKLDQRWKSSENFDDQIVLYKIALVLIALSAMEKKKPNYILVRAIFENALFTDNNIYHQVMSSMEKLLELLDISNQKLDNLKDQNEKMPWTMTALREAKVLENGQAITHNRAFGIGFGWAMAWLRETDIIELNPATLSQFSMLWIETYLTVINILNDWNPIVG